MTTPKRSAGLAALALFTALTGLSAGAAVSSFYDIKTTTPLGKPADPGRDRSSIYAFLGASGHRPAWNFSNYVVGKNGKVVAVFPSEVTPDAPGLRRAIATVLAAN